MQQGVAASTSRKPSEVVPSREVPSSAHIVRNAGGIATEDALRSLIISHHLLGTQEFIVINHTDCGMATFKDEALRKQLEQKTESYPVVPAHFHAFDDLEENV